MKKENNKIRSNYVQDTLADISLLENQTKGYVTESVQTLLSETLNKELNRILAEAEDGEDYEETEVDDTQSNDGGENTDTSEFSSEDDNEGEEDAELPQTDDTESVTDDSNDGDEWDGFQDYKTETGEYDFSNADDETIIKVYKLLKNDDEVIVTDNNGIINIKDNASGTEYMVQGAGNSTDDNMDDDTELDGEFDTDPMDDGMSTEDPMGDEMGTDDEFDLDDDETVYEITLNDNDGEEINEDLGYTTNYQKQTAMTTPGNNEPAKSSQTYSMDKGVPTGTEKPFGKGTGDKAPFDKNVKEGEEVTDETIDEEDDSVEEATNVGGFVQQNTTSKSHVPNSNGRNARNQSKGGDYTGTQTPRYSSSQMENIKRKAKSVFEENQELKGLVTEIKQKLMNAVVVNKNLGKIIQLVTENTTSKDEKINIVKRFGSDAKTIQESDRLYETISNELKNIRTIDTVANTSNKTLSESSNKNAHLINETTVYQSKDLQDSIQLMHRMGNL